MRDLRSNQKTIWYQNSIGSAAIRDENGDRTGEEQPVMEPPEQLRISVSGAAGAMEAAAFGGFTDYSRTACTANVNCPLHEGTLVWINRDASESPDYVVTKKADTINGVLYALKEVVP